MFFFILLSTILFFFCLYLYFNNKKLKQKNNQLELEIKTILERKLTYNKEDLISIENISIASQKTNLEESTNIKKEPQISKENISQSNFNSITDEKLVEKKYIAKTTNEYQPPKISNPITSNLKKTTLSSQTASGKFNNKSNNTKQKSKSEPTHLSISTDFNPNEFIQKGKKRVTPTIKKKKPNNEYLKELSEQLANELAPRTIELTDYEKDQEENAIISYQELLSLSSKIKVHDEEGDNFIDDLKEFRNSLH